MLKRLENAEEQAEDVQAAVSEVKHSARKRVRKSVGLKSSLLTRIADSVRKLAFWKTNGVRTDAGFNFFKKVATVQAAVGASAGCTESLDASSKASRKELSYEKV